MKKKILMLLLVVFCVVMTACSGATYTPGTFTDAGYETEFLGFRFNTPEGFALATHEELDQLMGISMDSLSEAGDITEAQAKYAQLTSIYEMMVTDSMGVTNANIILEKSVIPINTYVEVLKEQLQTISAMNVTFTGEEEVQLAGATYTKVSADVESNGISMYQEYYIRKVEGYIMCLTLTWADGFETEKEAIMNAFAAY